MLKNIGLYLLKQRRNAIGVALLCALLPFVGFPTFWISILLLGLVTLYKGGKEGFWVLLWVALPGLAWGFIGDPSLIVGVIALRAVIVWLLALILRRTASWAVILQCAALLGIISIIGLHMVIPDVAVWWSQELTTYWDSIAAPLHLANDSAQAQQFLQFAAQFATGALAVALLVMDLALLLFARTWQAVLFNPGGLAKELLQVRMSYTASALLLITVFAACFGSALALDVLPVVILPFTLAGLSLVHAQLKYKPELKLPLLMGLYFALILFLPYVAILLAFAAIIDSGYDFRSLRTKMGAEAK
jgi:hypothetical protein